MPRINRKDHAGSWHHVMNRAIARRTFFERQVDLEHFQVLLAETVEQRWLEIHAYALLPTHFHLLVRSRHGKLSTALRHVQLGYVRWFNRSRKRDGPLVRQRFLSKPVDSRCYRCVLVGYIDANAPEARLATHAAAYPYCSAFHYATTNGPGWLERSWIESVICECFGLDAYEPQRYPEVFARGFQPGHRTIVENTIGRRSGSMLGVDQLLGATDTSILDWMRRKAALADGTRPGAPIVAPEFVDRAVADSAREHGPWARQPRRRRRDGWVTLRALLLRQLAGARFLDIARALECSIEGARSVHREGMAALTEDKLFASRAKACARRALDLCFYVRDVTL